jgi:hypothetical protein
MDRLITMYQVKLMRPLIGMCSNGKLVGLPRAHNVLVSIMETPDSDISEDDLKEVKEEIDSLCDKEDKMVEGGD